MDNSLNGRLVNLRWWLLAALAMAIPVGTTVFGLGLPWLLQLAVLGVMAVANLLAAREGEAAGAGTPVLARHLLLDLAGLGVLLYLSGGATNPLVSLLLLPVVVAALALPVRWASALAAFAVAIYTLLLFHSLPLMVADVARATRLHLLGMWLTFLVSAALLAGFMARVASSLRVRDAQLAEAREQALRDAQVVALGQMAAGAAHEMGTPLATMNVLAGDLARDERLPADVREDLELLQGQIAACKRTISGMAERAGVGRAGDLRAVVLGDWLGELVGKWLALRPDAACPIDLPEGLRARRLMVDTGVDQALVSLLDNASRISPAALRLEVGAAAGMLRVVVCDGGPGFPAEVLGNAGRTPLVAGASGSGLGLWLARAAVERLGGQLCLENRVDGGRAILVLPLNEGSGHDENSAA